MPPVLTNAPSASEPSLKPEQKEIRLPKTDKEWQQKQGQERTMAALDRCLVNNTAQENKLIDNVMQFNQAASNFLRTNQMDLPFVARRYPLQEEGRVVDPMGMKLTIGDQEIFIRNVASIKFSPADKGSCYAEVKVLKNGVTHTLTFDQEAKATGDGKLFSRKFIRD